MDSSERQRSRSPKRRSVSPNHRRRSRSPGRHRSPNRQSKSSGGIAWKSKSKPRGEDRGDDARYYRDNRNDRGDRDSYKPRRYQDGRDRGRDNDRNQAPRDTDSRRNHENHRDEGPRDGRRNARRDETKRIEKKDPTSGAKIPPAQPATFIIVTVNDRLGTKTRIPCVPSDTIAPGDFKKLVANSIGRPAHEIMLKRQGERPFKDIITLEDYGISNGVQLDLELDTGE